MIITSLLIPRQGALMTQRCGAVHPQDPSRTCVAKGSTHGDHVDSAGIWPNTERIELVSSMERARQTKRRRGRLRAVVSDARAGKKLLLSEDQQAGGHPAYTKVTGMETAATSRTSEEFRDLFTKAMLQVATEKQEFSTNDVWDLLLSLGYQKIGSHQAAGTIGPAGVKDGLWERTDRAVKNTAPWAHSKDLDVQVYRSLIHQSGSPKPTWGKSRQIMDTNGTIASTSRGER